MTDEEKEAIEKVMNLTPDDLLNCWEGGEEEFEAIQVVLNLLSKKDKIIDLMALHIASSAIVDDMVCVYKDCENESCTADMAIQCTKEYFYKKVEKENE